MILTADDARRLIPLLESAMDEVDMAVERETTPQPDDPMALMESYDWGRQLLARCREVAAKETP